MVRARKAAAQSDVKLFGDKPAARAILDARAGFNAALEARDLAGIGAVLVETAVLVPGDDAELIQGRQAQLDAWTSIFSQMSDVTYVRLPARIEVGEDGYLAAESGRWRGGWTSEGMQISYTGRYFAKWRLEGLNWLIEAETFVTIKRAGKMI